MSLISSLLFAHRFLLAFFRGSQGVVSPPAPFARTRARRAPARRAGFCRRRRTGPVSSCLRSPIRASRSRRRGSFLFVPRRGPGTRNPVPHNVPKASDSAGDHDCDLFRNVRCLAIEGSTRPAPAEATRHRVPEVAVTHDRVQIPKVLLVVDRGLRHRPYHQLEPRKLSPPSTPPPTTHRRTCFRPPETPAGLRDRRTLPSWGCLLERRAPSSAPRLGPRGRRRPAPPPRSPPVPWSRLAVTRQVRPAPVAARSPFREASILSASLRAQTELLHRQLVDVGGRLLLGDHVTGQHQGEPCRSSAPTTRPSMARMDASDEVDEPQGPCGVERLGDDPRHAGGRGGVRSRPSP